MKPVLNPLTGRFDMVNDAGVAPVDPSADNNLVAFNGIAGVQKDSGIAAVDVASAVSLKHAAATIGAMANGLSIAGQEISLAAATAVIPGAMSAAYADKLDRYAIAAGKTLTVSESVTLTAGAAEYTLTVPGTGVALVKSTALTAGYIPFGIAGNLVGEDAKLFWDNVNKRLGIGTTSPSARLEALPSSGGIALKVGRVSGKPSIQGISDTDWLIIDAGTSGRLGLNFWSTGDVVLTNGGGNVGIGIITSGSKLQVNGNAAIGYSASTAGPANGLAISGNVGIGTTESTISDGIGLHIAGKIIRIGTAKTLASAGATGNTGEICWDAGYIYVCTATNTWKRAAIATW